MAYNGSLPADTEYISVAPAELRENYRALKDDKIVNAAKILDLIPGNASGNISVNNGTLCSGLNAEKLNGQLASYYSVSNHVHSAATTTVNGFMSNTDKTKLDGIAAGAEVNQAAFGIVKVGTTNVQAEIDLDTLELKAGTGITLNPDTTNDAITIAITQDGHTHAAGTTGAAGFISTADKTKLDSIATGAEVNQNSFANIVVGASTIQADGKSDSLTLTAGTGITLNADTINDAVTIAVTANGHTHSDATTSASGFLSAADKTKLNGIATGAEVNQNAFTSVIAGGNTIAADSKTDTLTINAGSGVTITSDAATDAVTIAVTANGHTHSDATTSAAGFLSTVDKTKLDSIATGAEVNQNAFSNIKVGAVTVAADSETDTVEMVAGTGITLTGDATNDKVTIALATTANADTLDTYHAGNGSGAIPISNGTVNTNLNADIHDGYHAGNATGQIPVSNGTVNTNLNADMVDGVHLAGLVQTSDVVTTATASKILKLNSSAKLPASITGDADTVDGKHATDFADVLNASATTPATIGWYRIATSPVDIARCAALFEINWTVSGSHGFVRFSASTMYGSTNSATIEQLSYTSYGASTGLTQARLVYHTTYSGNYAYIEVYNSTATALTISVQAVCPTGWTLITPSTVGSVPSGYTSEVLTFSRGLVSMDQFTSTLATGTSPLKVTSTTVNTNLNADMVDGYHASTSATASTIPVRDSSGNVQGNITGNAPTASNADKVGGYSASVVNTGSTAAVRDLSGDLTSRLFRTEYTTTTGGTCAYILGQNAIGSGVDNYARPIPLATLKTALGSMPANGGTSAACSGNSATATRLSTMKLIQLTGDVSGIVAFDGSIDVSIATAVANDSHTHTLATISDFNGSGKQLFTSSGTFTVPAGITKVWVSMSGGGGGGSNGYAIDTLYYWGKGGGGAAAYLAKAVTVTPGADITVTIGAGGTAGGPGTAGGTTSFGSLLSCAGGGGGGNASNGSPGAAGGAGGTAGGEGCGGSSIFGAGGAYASVSLAGRPGAGYGGGGGGGGGQDKAGAAGTPGFCLIEW